MNTKVEDLYFDMTDAKPINFDWTEGYGKTWEFTGASRCEECNEILVGRSGGKHSGLVDSECNGWVPDVDGPMMNYYYPLPDSDFDENEIAKKLVDLPLVLVHFLEQDEWGLALTGGGQDLSWEICEAYMLLGYLPPVHFAGDLPDEAGRGASEKDKWIIAGCLRALDGTKYRVERAIERLTQRYGK